METEPGKFVIELPVVIPEFNSHEEIIDYILKEYRKWLNHYEGNYHHDETEYEDGRIHGCAHCIVILNECLKTLKFTRNPSNDILCLLCDRGDQCP